MLGIVSQVVVCRISLIRPFWELVCELESRLESSQPILRTLTRSGTSPDDVVGSKALKSNLPIVVGTSSEAFNNGRPSKKGFTPSSSVAKLRDDATPKVRTMPQGNVIPWLESLRPGRGIVMQIVWC